MEIKQGYKNVHMVTSETIDCPRFIIIKMSISAEHRKKRMSQCAARSIEWVSISMLSLFKPDLDVNLAGFLLDKIEIRVLRPNLQSFFDFPIDVTFG